MRDSSSSAENTGESIDKNAESIPYGKGLEVLVWPHELFYHPPKRRRKMVRRHRETNLDLGGSKDSQVVAPMCHLENTDAAKPLGRAGHVQGHRAQTEGPIVNLSSDPSSPSIGGIDAVGGRDTMGTH